jgi:hypothetical protein
MSTGVPIAEFVAARRELPPPTMRRLIRTTAGASLELLAVQFDPPVTRHAVMHWERGTRYPRPRHLVQYMEILRQLQGR